MSLTAGKAELGGVWAGLHFVLQPGWHIYWRNPGDSGGPPTVQWRLPAGVSAGPLLWPAPDRIPVGPLVNYGYHDEVTLPVYLTFANRANAGDQLIDADVRWLICKDVCLNQRASLRVSLASAAANEVKASALLDRARAQVPAKAPAAWRAQATMRGRQFHLVLAVDRRVGAATFFPIDESRLMTRAPSTWKYSGAPFASH